MVLKSRYHHKSGYDVLVAQALLLIYVIVLSYGSIPTSVASLLCVKNLLHCSFQIEPVIYV